MVGVVEYVSRFVKEVIFFSGDVQTTTIAIAVSSSIACSLLWLLINLLSPPRTSPHVRSHHRRNTHKARDSSGQVNTATKSIWAERKIERNCAVPCISCNVKSADKICRYILCSRCCQNNVWSVCDYHDKCLSKTHTTDDTCQLKPKHMDFSFLKLSRCPDRVGFVGSQLRHLNLSNNSLHSIPPEIGFLLGLQHLDLHDNTIATLPESFRNLRNLQDLDLGNNKFDFLPECITKLYKLQTLTVERNGLTALPPSVHQLTQLTHFNASKNLLVELPGEICKLSKLQILKLCENKLVELPSDMNHMVCLSHLYVNDNMLSSIPNNITKCVFLSTLKLANNRLTELPVHINRLHSLQELDVSCNQLRYLPASMHSLQPVIFNVTSNPWWTLQTTLSEVSAEFPTLMELAACQVTQSKLPWRQQLPVHLQESLCHMRYCVSCERPLVSSLRSKLTFQRSHRMTLPLCQVICSHYFSSKCDFLCVADEGGAC